MSTRTGAELVVAALEDEGVPFTFGIPGAQNLELYDALDRSSRVRPILVTDEQAGAFMADGVSRASGRLGCLNLVPGAGLTHALSGIAEAFMDGVPLLVLASGVRSDIGKAFQLHDVPQIEIARPVTKAQFRVTEGVELYRAVRAACRVARTPPFGPVIVEIPANLFIFRHQAMLDIPDQASLPTPDTAMVAALAERLAAARRPLLYLGAGAAAAGPDLIRLAELLQAPVATTIQGKGVFPERHPLWLWCGFGPAAPDFARSIAQECDATLAIGCRFAEVGTGSYGLDPPRPLLHVDIDPAVLGRNYTADLAVCADAGKLVAALLPQLAPRAPDDALHSAVAAGHRAVQAAWDALESRHGVPGPRLVAAVQEAAGPNAVFVADSGNGLFVAAEVLRLDVPGRFLAPVDFSAMGYALPAAIGAALSRPEGRTVAFMGDGAFLMTGLELMTAMQQNARLLLFVLRDRELTQIAQFQDTAFARRSASDLPDFDLPLLCRSLGVPCIQLSSADALPDVLGEAFAAAESGPVVVEVAFDNQHRSYFTRGVVKTNFGRLPWLDRLRFVTRAVARRVLVR
jgi:acetolactate synthase-1/2/3 large subunit